MGIRSLKNNTFSRELALGSPAGNAYDCIGVVSLSTTSAASIEFTSIPSTYAHLQVRFVARTLNDSVILRLTINSDTGSNYARHFLEGNASAASSGAASGTTAPLAFAHVVHSDYAAAKFGSGILEILDYSNVNKYKTFRTLSGFDSNETPGGLPQGRVILYSGLWQSTSAITSIKIEGNGGNLAQHSHFALYGIW